jgi:hypothetical protein
LPFRAKPSHVTKLRGVAIHYAGFNVEGDPAAIMRSIQRTHMEQRGWWDLAYSACVALDGTVLEGRGLLVRTGANGTNASNRDYLAICLLIGPDQTPTTAMVEAVRELIGVVQHYQPLATEIIGHRDIKATSCPGDDAYDLVRRGAFQPDADVDPTPQPVTLASRVEALEDDVAELKRGVAS